MLTEVGDEIFGEVLDFLGGDCLGRASLSSKWLHERIDSGVLWRRRVEHVLGFCVLSEEDESRQWRELYSTYCHKQENWKIGWQAQSVNHGLGDRVAQPQLFCSRSGNYLYCYGGWTQQGPTNTLSAVRIDAVKSQLQFDRVRTTGRPCLARGVQTLTPLWQSPQVTTTECSGLSYILAMGGAGGGYANETNDWRVGKLNEDEMRLEWLQNLSNTFPQSRAAHTATYVPPIPEYPDGAVFVFGGHSSDCQLSLSSVDILNLSNWQWEQNAVEECILREIPKARHGHTAVLTIVDSRPYIVIIGGGTGNILHGFGGAVHEFADAQVLDCQAKKWLPVTISLSQTFGRHHTASPCLGNRAILFGGGARPRNVPSIIDAGALVKTALLNKQDEHEPFQVPPLPQLGTARPRGRKMHAAVCLLPWLPVYCLFGGWEFGPHFNDFWLSQLFTTAKDQASAAAAAAPTLIANGSINAGNDTEDDDVIVTVNIDTDTGVHQVHIPRFIFNRLVSEGILAAGAAAVHETHQSEEDAQDTSEDDDDDDDMDDDGFHETPPPTVPPDDEDDDDDQIPFASGPHYHRLFCTATGQQQQEEDEAEL